MATRLLPPGYQEFLPTGAIAPGAKLYTYSAGTSNPKTTYTDAALTVPNANPVVADASGRFGDIFAGVGDYRLVMNTSADALIWSADPVEGGDGASSGESATNLLVNGDFRIQSRTLDNSIQYFTDLQSPVAGWSVATQTGVVQVAQESTVASRWASNAIRLTNRVGSAQRMGAFQWVMPEDVAHLGGNAVAMGGSVYCSVSQPIRYAIIQWATYPTALPADPVADWTSGTYTGGAFFTSNVTVIATGSLTPAAGVWTSLPFITGTCSANPQALGVMVWTEGTIANGANLRLTDLRLTQGSTAADFERRHWKLENLLGSPDPFLAQRNLVTNGDFNVWQAGTSVSIPASTTTTACYGPDRWCMETSANQACVISRQDGTANTESVVLRARYAARVRRTAGQTGTDVLRFQHPFETADLFSIRDRQLALTFFVAAGADFAGTLAVKMLAGTGSEGRRTNAAAYTGEATVFSQSLTLIPGAGGYHFATISAGWGADILDGVGDYTQATLCFEWTPSGTAGADDWFEVSSVRLNIGDAPAPFVAEDIADTLARCQRFFAKSFPQATTPAQNAGVTGAVSFPQVVGASTAMTLPAVTFPATMRAAPTVTLFNPSAANAQARNVGTGTDCTLTSATATEWGFSGTATTPGGSAAGQQLLVHYTADARL